MSRADAETPKKKPSSQRCSADRTSEHINLNAARNIIDAVKFAGQAGRHLNRFVTIHWAAGGAPEGVLATTQFLKQAGDWLAVNGTARTWAWTRETGPNIGEHVHIAMHVPPTLGARFGQRQRGWLKAAGAKCWKGVIHTRAVGRSPSHAIHGVQHGETYEYHIRTTVEYLLKGADSETAAILGLTSAREPQGVLIGKRAGTSQSIGAATRRSGLIRD